VGNELSRWIHQVERIQERRGWAPAQLLAWLVIR
jgi:hypothetical protein